MVGDCLGQGLKLVSKFKSKKLKLEGATWGESTCISKGKTLQFCDSESNKKEVSYLSK